MANHPPVVNHPLRPLYRTLAAAAGVFMLLVGVISFMKASGGAFDNSATYALGLRTNLAFGAFAALVGAVTLAVTVIGRNLDSKINQIVAYLLFVVGFAQIALMQTDGNIFNASITSAIVVFIVGLVLLSAGLYSRVAPATQRA